MTASKDLEPLKNFGSVFWRNQFRTTIPLPDRTKLDSLNGKVAVLTGSNTGLGYEAARQLLALGLSHLVMGVRSIERGKAAASHLQKANATAKINVWPLDMERYDSVKAFASKCDTELPRIDYVVLNAGLSRLVASTNKTTGHEPTIQVNHLSTALLTTLLLPTLKAKASGNSAPARLTIVNSLTAHLCKFPNRNERPLISSFDDTSITPFDPRERYGVSKLLNQLFTVKLADQVSSKDVIINMVDPGLTKGTKLARDTSGLLRVAASLFNYICGRPLDQGAATYIYALMEHGAESHGCFLMSNKIAP
jgi:NAD(P)-dependent dehydrogenase (short-subunit alcohol dehydrogenase family)